MNELIKIVYDKLKYLKNSALNKICVAHISEIILTMQVQAPIQINDFGIDPKICFSFDIALYF